MNKTAIFTLLLAVSLSTTVHAADQGAINIQMVKLEQGFEIGKFEVTQGQYKAVMGTNPSHFSECGDNCPVENVSWEDAQAFIARLNKMTGKSYRLPSKDEWELACRAGGEDEYCGGNDLDKLGWYYGNSREKTHAVGLKKPNDLGLYDMSGNVWEWCQDWYDEDKKWRVLRGGSWGYGPQLAPAANRNIEGPAARGINGGFRLARTLP